MLLSRLLFLCFQILPLLPVLDYLQNGREVLHCVVVYFVSWISLIVIHLLTSLIISMGFCTSGKIRERPGSSPAAKRKLFSGNSQGYTPSKRTKIMSSPQKEECKSGKIPPQKPQGSGTLPKVAKEECTVWLQLGSQEIYQSKHKIDKNATRAGLNAEKFAKYLSLEDQNFTINATSLLCNACYQDCRKYMDQESGVEPRWVKAHKIQPFSPEKHCPVCHIYVDSA